MTPAEIALLDKVAKATGTSVSAYVRTSTKKQMLEDLLNISGHHSTFSSSSLSAEATKQIEDLVEDMDYCDSLRKHAEIINAAKAERAQEESDKESLSARKKKPS